MSQRNANVPGGDSVVLVDATSANETIYLPRGFAVGRGFTVKRVDNSAFTVTVVPPSGETLDGVVDATVTVGGNTGKSFMLRDPLLWESFGGVSGAEVAANSTVLAAFSKKAVGRLARMSQRPTVNPFPTIHPSPPTVTESATQTITSSLVEYWAHESNHVTPLGGVYAYNSSRFSTDNNVNLPSTADVHLGFVLNGTTVEVGWRAQTSGGAVQQYWIFVDGLPMTAAPATTGLTVTAGNAGYLKIVFAARGSYDVRVYFSGSSAGAMNAFQIRLPITDTLKACSRRPWQIAWFTDSFGATNNTIGTPSEFDIFPRRVSYALGAECIQSTQPGTGYIKPTAFDSDTRVNAVTAANPDLIVAVGGVNDYIYTPAQVGAAVTSFLAKCQARLPNVPVIVAGPQCQTDTVTLDAQTAAINKAVRDAALAAPNCLGHIDMIGNATTGTVPDPYANGGVYAVGDLVTRNGGVMQCITAHTGPATPNTRYWNTVSWLTGTGRVGATTGNGNRDTCLGTDTLHPALPGQDVLTGNFIAEIRSRLLAAASGPSGS